MQMVAIDKGAATGTRSKGLVGDVVLVAIVATFLSAWWAFQDWGNLSRLILPDADDMMRLAQVRDWLAGQGTNDWTQYRVAPPLGTPMHWSRVNDVGIAGIILAVRPWLGQHAAELAAILVYPALLFGCHLLLSARIARRLWGSQGAFVAVVLGALAYPGITVFVPGRIDHHALQVVLTEVAVLALMRRARVLAAAVAGTALASSLVIGLETVPQIAALVGIAFLTWVVRGDTERRRMSGLALGTGATTALFVLFLRPTLWSPDLCDAFTPATSQAAMAGAAVLGLLGAIGARLPGWRSRLAVGGALGLAVLAGTVLTHPACLTGPYGKMDPFLRREFIPYIDEAKPILRQSTLVRILQLGGLMLMGCVGTGWLAWGQPRRWPTWGPVAAVVIVSGLLTVVQVRGTYIGAPLSAPVLAGVVLAARRRVRKRAPALVIAWLACTGVTWCEVPAVARNLAQGVDQPDRHAASQYDQTACVSGDTWAEVDRYPPGVVIASTSLASYLIGATHMSTVGASYHRNNRGNMDMYRYFLGRPAQGWRIARQWRVRYVAFCPGDFNEIQVVRRWPHSLATALTFDRAPSGFRRLPLHGSRLRLYHIES